MEPSPIAPARPRLGTLGAVARAHLTEAYTGLMSAGQRSGLALIGIVVGIASVSSMISIGDIVRAEAVREFEQLGTDIVNIRLRAREAQMPRIAVPVGDAEGVASLSTIVAAAPYAAGSAPVVLAGKSATTAQVVGATPEMADLGRLKLAAGRFVSPLDHGSNFCTVGADVAEALREASQGQALGMSVRIRDVVFTVVGVLERTALGRRPFDPDSAVVLPIATATRVIPDATVRDILGRMRSDAHHSEAATEVAAYFARRLPEARVQVRSAEELIEQMHRQLRLYTLLLGAVGAISLLVGGIGVMNVMLVAVAERKAEIGIRRALGARRRDIQAQFLTEALLLSVAGGVVGVLLGFGLTWTICQAVGWTFSVSVGGTALGALVAGGAGIVFGFFPAHQAARLDPVTALQG